MKTLLAGAAIGLGVCGAIAAASIATAQIPGPQAKAPDGAALFRQQCGTCHTTNMSEPFRQGPPLAKIVGQHAGRTEGFRYSQGFSQADFAWDEPKLDAWLTNPQTVIPGAVMAYRQAKPEVRMAIIAYLKELN